MSDRLRLAETLLQEAVYASRARQAAGVSLLLAGEKDGSSPTNCGLGREAAVELGLSDEGRAALEALWPGAVAPAEAARVRTALVAWVERNDALDRDRNHFLKAFRTKHGFDRRAWAPERLAEYERSLGEINTRVNVERREAARALLGDDA
jgi:hypothetical protein